MEQRMRSVMQVKLKLNAVESKAIPWELMYLIKKEEVDVLPPLLFKNYIVVHDTSVMEPYLSLLTIPKVKNLGTMREDRKVKEYTNEEAPLLASLVELEKYKILIPLKTRKKQKVGTKLSYLVSQKYREKVENAQRHHTIYGFRRTDVKQMPTFTLHLGHNKKEGHPCSYCARFPLKAADDHVCALGSLECIDNIVIGDC